MEHDDSSVRRICWQQEGQETHGLPRVRLCEPVTYKLPQANTISGFMHLPQAGFMVGMLLLHERVPSAEETMCKPSLRGEGKVLTPPVPLSEDWQDKTQHHCFSRGAICEITEYKALSRTKCIQEESCCTTEHYGTKTILI